MASEERTCCVNNCPLPNRYAVAGRCTDPGCDAVFCALHWNRGNRRCPKHGYEQRMPIVPPPVLPPEEPKKETTVTDPQPEMPEKKSFIDPAKAKAAMQEALRLVKKLGVGAQALLAKLRKDRSPQAMMATLDQSLQANRAQRDEAAGRVERLFNEIAEKKKAFQAAPKARQRVLELELRTRLSEYKAAERQLAVLLENERVLATVQGRMTEIAAYGIRGVSEAAIDEVTDEIEERASEAEGVADATRELEKAGRRRERESEREDMWSELEGFDSEAPSPLAGELAGFDAPEAPPPAGERPAAKKEKPAADDAEV